MSSPFEEAWRKTLKTQYALAAQSGNNESGLAQVMAIVGYSDAEIVEAKVLATITDVDRNPALEKAFFASVNECSKVDLVDD